MMQVNYAKKAGVLLLVSAALCSLVTSSILSDFDYEVSKALETLQNDVEGLGDIPGFEDLIGIAEEQDEPSCQHYTNVGCYDKRQKLISDMKFLMDNNGETPMDSEKFHCLCAEITRAYGSHYYAVSNGECFYGDESVSSGNTSTECSDPNDKKKRCEDSKNCIGYGNGTYVYNNNIVSTTTICERHTQEIKCPAGETIRILSATYGRQSKAVCTHTSMSNTNCKSPQEVKVREKCDWKNKCSLTASNDEFGDPCFGTNKYLEVQYQCVPELKIVTKKNDEINDEEIIVEQDEEGIVVQEDENDTVWKLQQKKVCFGTKGDDYGTFTMKDEGSLDAIKLVHASGYVSCRYRNGNSNWGCRGYNQFAPVVTDTNNLVIFPHNVDSRGWYTLAGYTYSTNMLILKSPVRDTKVTKGQKLRLWYGEDLKGYTEGDNHGKACADVYADVKVWKLQQRNVCFGTRGDKYGTFTMKEEGSLDAIKLVHASGYVSCRTRNGNSNWGCKGYDTFSAIVTDMSDSDIFPNNADSKTGSYPLAGYTSTSNMLIFKSPTKYTKVTKGQKLKLWYGEDLRGHTEVDNHGKTCTDVYADVKGKSQSVDKNKIVPVTSVDAIKCRSYVKMGCFDKRKAPLKDMSHLMDNRDENRTITIDKLVCMCSAISTELGRHYFSVSNGECFIGSVAPSPSGKSKECVESTDNTAECISTSSSVKCVGHKNGTYVYRNSVAKQDEEDLAEDTTLKEDQKPIVPVKKVDAINCRSYVKMGCFDKRKAPLKDMSHLMDNQDENKTITIDRLVCMCSAISTELGRHYFSVSNDECLIGSVAPSPSGTIKECVESTDNTAECISTSSSVKCVGHKNGTYVYRNSIDGLYSAWGQWTACDATCGKQNQQRKRTCTDPAPFGGGRCVGSDTDSKACQEKAACKVGFSKWQQGTCNVKCGDGKIWYTRTCIDPTGRTCIGKATRYSKHCSVKKCPVCKDRKCKLKLSSNKWVRRFQKIAYKLTCKIPGVRMACAKTCGAC